MTAQTVELPADLRCDGCTRTTDECLSMREDCCQGCTHYPAPVPDDVDEVAIQRAVAGDKSVPLNRAEFARAHQQLHDAGFSAAQIADRLGVTQRSVDRWNNGHARPISRRPGGDHMDTTDDLLRKARSNPSKRIQTAAKRAQEAVNRVQALLAEDEGKAEARRKVAELERQLREAKAALRGSSVAASVSAIDTKAVRAWAGANGVEVPARGRIPQTVVAAYTEAQAS